MQEHGVGGVIVRPERRRKARLDILETPVKPWKLLLPLPLLAGLAMVPQGQAPDDPTTVVSIAELHYVGQNGAPTIVSARNVVEIRFLEDCTDHIRLELVYDNGDYSMIDATAFHLIRSGTGSREVRLVRTKVARMRFPRLP